jgi:hypothetical protein
VLLPEAPASLAAELAKQYDESALGISHYLRPGGSFQGIIKSRFADFQVHELDQRGGRAVRLVSTELPAEEVQQQRQRQRETEDMRAIENAHAAELLTRSQAGVSFADQLSDSSMAS